MMDGPREIMRDQNNPKDLTVDGTFENGELTQVNMKVSWDPKTQQGDEISYDKNGKLMVNGQEAHPPMTTPNGTVISGSDGGKIDIKTKGGDHFTLDKTACPAINLEGDVNPNRGTDAIHSDVLGNFDDDPSSTWVAKNDALAEGGGGGGAAGAAGGAGGAAAAGGGTGLSSPTDPFEELRKIFSDMATAGGTAPAPSTPAGGFLGKVKSPDLKAAILDHAKGGIDVSAMASAISDPAERDKFLHAADGSGSIEDAIKALSKPSEQLGVLKALVGDDKAADLQSKLFSPTAA